MLPHRFQLRFLTAVFALAVVVSTGFSRADGTEYTTASQSAAISVTLSLGAPAAYYDFDGSTVSRREPSASETHNLTVTVKDEKSGAALPGCRVTAALDGPDEKPIGTSITLTETWNGAATHYGANIQVPSETTTGSATLRIEPPRVRYLDLPDNSITFTKPVVVRLRPVTFPAVARTAASQPVTGTSKIEWPEGRRPYAPPTPYPGSQK